MPTVISAMRQKREVHGTPFQKRALYSLVGVFLIVTFPAQARMYQWVNPQSGYTQFSGKPPAWYRSAGGGPRVLVFENGKLVDDTAIHVSESARDNLRARAFQEAEEMRQSVAAKKEEPPVPPETKEADLLIPERIEDHFATTENSDTQAAPPPLAPSKKARDPEAETIEQLRALIAEWDKQRTEEAKQLLEAKDQEAPLPAPRINEP